MQTIRFYWVIRTIPGTNCKWLNLWSPEETRYPGVLLVIKVAGRKFLTNRSLRQMWIMCLSYPAWTGTLTFQDVFSEIEAIDQDAFAGWHYITDPTHVCFFSKKIGL